VKQIYPVPGRFIPGVPHVPQRVSAEDAAYLVAQEAFTTDRPPPEEAAASEPEDPPDGGSSDAKEA